MTTAEYRDIDAKTDWGDGPWQQEPDIMLWVDPLSGIQCMVARAHGGHLCGYVGLPPGHPLHGEEASHVEFRAHGGINFARGFPLSSFRVDPPLTDSTEYWWLGFDCGHSWDYSPAVAAHFKQLAAQTGRALFSQLPGFCEPRGYCIIEYVKEEVTDLAAQIHAATVPNPLDFILGKDRAS